MSAQFKQPKTDDFKEAVQLSRAKASDGDNDHGGAEKELEQLDKGAGRNREN